MQRLNAIDAISPAFTRVHELLFKPFRVGRTFKLTLVSYCAFAGSFFLPFPLLYVGVARLIAGAGRSPLFAALWAAATVATLIYFGLYYVFARLQLVDFEMVVTLTRVVGPMWRKYPRKVWPWIGIKVALGLIAMSALLPVLLNGAHELIGVFTAVKDLGPHPPPEAMAPLFRAFYGFYGLTILMFLIPKTISTVLEDFAMPFFLVENLPLGAAVQRGWAVLAADPLNCIGYLAMKLFLAIVGNTMLGVAIQICMIPVVLAFGIVGFVGWLILHSAGPAGALLMVAGAVVLGACFVAVVFYAAILSSGYLFLLLDAYAIYFLGGRYPMLGNLLEPGPGGPFTPPPVFPSKEERKDAGSGPPMPMNPAVA
jgi:hypothetical protein